MIRHPESQGKLQHGTSERNSVSLLAAPVLQLPRRRRGISAQRLTGNCESRLHQVHPRSTCRLSGKCWLQGNWHKIAICRGLGKSTSGEDFRNLSLMALNIYCTPARQIPKSRGALSQAASWFRCCNPPKQSVQALMKNDAYCDRDLQLKNSEMLLIWEKTEGILVTTEC